MATPVRLLIVAVFFLFQSSWAKAQGLAEEGEIVRNGSLRESIQTPSAGRSDFPRGDWLPSESVPPTHESTTRRDEFVRPAGFEEEISQPTPKPHRPALPASSSKPLPLAARTKSDKPGSQRSATLTKPTESLITVGGSLCVVLSLFFGVAWLTRRGGTKSVTKLPGEVIEVLGKAPLVKGQDMQLVRIGAKLLLICVTPHGCETLTEITDDHEVEHLSAICRRNNPNSVTAAFNQVLANMGREPASGFTGDARTVSDRRGVRYHA